MSNELRKHKRSDTIKWGVIFLVVILLAVSVLAMFTRGFKTINP